MLKQRHLDTPLSRPDEIAKVFVDVFPAMTPEEQRLSLTLYRLLAKGAPVALERLTQAAAMDLESVRDVLARWGGVFFDDDGRVIGYWGLTVRPMRHRFEVDGRTLYTWCAWDALFIPQLLGGEAQVTSPCATNEQPVSLVVSPDRVESVHPKGTVLSFLLPDVSDVSKDVITSFCHFVYFFRSRADGEKWIRKHDDTFLLSVDEAFAIGRKMNAARYVALNQKESAK